MSDKEASGARSLDDAELERWHSAVLWGDAGVEAWASEPVRRLPARQGTGHGDRPRTCPGARPGAGGASGPGGSSRCLSLDGEWLLAGAEPARQHSIERWAEPAATRPTAQPVTWWRVDTDRSGWLPATVPGTVQRALLDAGLAPDPVAGSETYDELVEHGTPVHWPWHFRRTRVERQEWWYARRFSLPEDWRGQRLRLRFDGLDYSGTVYLDGRPVAHHTGAYGGPDVDVSRLVRFGAEGDNELVVRIEPPPQDWHGVLKPSPGWGWHYGHLITSGIWRGVTIETVPDVELGQPFVTTRSLDDRAAVLDVQWEVQRASGAEDAQGTVDVEGVVRDPDGTAVASFTCAVDLTRPLTRVATQVTVADPRPWWPHGYGGQPLYQLELRTAGVSPGSAVETEFGVRTVEMRALPEREGDDVYRWRFTVNGRPLFLKGANWCWTDPLGDRPFADDAHLLDLVVDANLQMLRVWGGGPVERDQFYAACDRRGLLVYQEFPLSFGLPDASAVPLQPVDEQVARIVTRLRNHPCLVMWGGGNENEAALASDDVLELVGRRVTQLDPSRPFHRTDPWGGSVHSYAVYHEGQPIDAGYRDLDPVVLGEYGTASQCSLESMARYLDPALLDQWPPRPHGAIVQHQAQFSLFELFKQARYANYGPLTGWRDFVEYSQLAQGEALRFASERVRAGAGRRTSAYWFYKVGEVFPGSSWAVVDHYNVPKLSYYLAKRFGRARSAFAVSDRLEPVQGERFVARLHLANDTPVPLHSARVTATLLDARLREIARVEVGADAAPDRTLEVGRLEAVVPAECEPLLLEVRLDAPGEEPSTQWYWFNARPRTDRIRELEALEVDDLWERPVEELLAPYAEARPAPLRELPRTTLEARLDPECLYVANTGPVAAPVVRIDGFPHGRGCFLADDAFGLAAGEARTLPLVAPAGELGELRVRAWNAESVRPS